MRTDRRRERAAPRRNAPPSRGAAPQPVALSGGKARGWLRTKWPVMRFMLIMGVLLGAFFAATSTRAFQQGFFPAYMSLNASWSAAALRLCGEDASSSGAYLRSPRFAVEIRRGCEAIEPTVLFIAAVAAFPVSIAARVVGVLLGLLGLSLLNLLRIVSLFYVGIYWPGAFETMHVEVWQPAFIVFALALWIAWAIWATRPAERPVADVTARGTGGGEPRGNSVARTHGA